MFKGSHSVTIDAKGRIAVPAPYRQPLLDDCGGRLVITRHWEGCLLLYPASAFQAFESRLLGKSSFDPEVRRIQRFLIGNARDLDMDRQGRILLPANLRAVAGLDTRAVLSGLGHLFELWDEALFEQINTDAAEALAQKAAAGNLPAELLDLSL